MLMLIGYTSPAMSKKKKKGLSGSITNRRARFDYNLNDSFKAGLVLFGPEVRSIRSAHVSLQGSFITMKDGEAWLMNAQVMPLKTNAAHLTEDMQIRNRKLLLKVSELKKLEEAKHQGYSIIPTRILNKGHFIKVEIAIGKGKRQYDKRETIKKRETERNIRREYKR